MEFSDFLEKETQALANDLVREDDLGAVIRSHIRIENILNRYVELLLKYPDHLKSMDLDYHQLVCLAAALGIANDLSPALKSLGKLRNDFAHELTTVLDKNRVNGLYNQLNSAKKQQVQKLSQDLWLAHEPDKPYPRFPALSPKDQFIAIAIIIWAAVNGLFISHQISKGKFQPS